MSSNQFNMIEINGTEGNDNLFGTGEADVLFGLGGDDLLSGSSGGDSLFGFRGNDTLNGEDGNDSLFGNQNRDLLIGGNGNDVLFGGKEGDVIDDGEGDDQLFGNLGDDVLQAGPGNDQRFGGKENDTVIGGTGNDQVFGDLGNDILWGVDPNGINPGIGEIDTLTGGPEQDVFVLGDQAQLYYIGLGDNDFALVTDFNVVEDQISIDNNQVIFTETTLNQFGFGVAISSQSGDLVAFIQNANISQFPNNSNPTEPTQPVATFTPPPPPPNTPPIADNDNYSTAFQSPLTVDGISGVLNGDSDGDGDAITAILVNSPGNGNVNLNGDGSFSYTPNAGFSGVDSFIYVANDGELNSNVATVTIAVAEPPTPTPTPTPTPNTPPNADNDNYNTAFQSPLTVDGISGVLNGDSDGDGDAITAILVNSPANGNVNLNGDGSFSYTPNAGFSGVDSFIYVANDGELNSDVATVTIDVGQPQLIPNTPPNADNDNYNTAFQSPLLVDASVGVLNGDSDGDGDAISAILVNSPTNGNVNLNPDGSFGYTPNAGFSGVDSFIYVANDGELNSNVATVTIAVAEPPTPTPTPTPTPNTPPNADNDNYNTAFQSPLTVDGISGVLNGDSDGDGDAITAILVNSPGNGNVNLNGDGSFSYTPNAGFSGVDSFIYVANDGELNSNVATVTIDVGQPPVEPINTPPNADNDNYNTAFQSPLLVDASVGVLNGDSDADGDALNAILVNPSANGSLNLNGDGSFSYTPNAGFSGVDSFIYVANDGELNSNVATVTIDVGQPPVEPINTPPNADNDNYNTAFQSPLLVDASVGVLNGDSDADGDALNAILVNPSANGSLNLNGDGSFSYTPNAGFSGVDSFIYIANDGELNSNVATVTIDVEEPQPVEQTRKLNGYSQRDVNDFVVRTTFLVTEIGNDGQQIVDQTIDENGNDSDEDLGIFPGAVQDFISYNSEVDSFLGSGGVEENTGIILIDGSVSGEFSSINFQGETELFEEGSNVTLSFNEEGEPIFTGLAIETQLTPVVDFRVRLIEQDQIISELEPTNEEVDLIGELDESFSEGLIVFEFLNTDSEEPFEQLFLFTNELSESEIEDATNSLESIVGEDLLGSTLKKEDAIRVLTGELNLSEIFSEDSEVILEETVAPEDNSYYSQRIDDRIVLTTFLVANEDNNGQEIVDQTIDGDGIDTDTNLGLFPGVIQDFVTYNTDSGDGITLPEEGDPINFDDETILFGDFSNITLGFDEEGQPTIVFNEENIEPELTEEGQLRLMRINLETEFTPVVNLRVRKVVGQDQIFDEFDFTDEEIGFVDSDDLPSERMLIFEFFKTRNTENPIEELILPIEELLLEELILYTPEPDPENPEEPDVFDLAVNSLDLIIEENLLSFPITTKLDARVELLEGFIDPDNIIPEESIEETILVDPIV